MSIISSGMVKWWPDSDVSVHVVSNGTLCMYPHNRHNTTSLLQLNEHPYRETCSIQELSSLIHGFLEQIPEANVKISLSKLVNAPEPLVMTSKTNIMGVIALMCSSAEVGCSFAFLAGKRDLTGHSMFKDGILRADIDHAVQSARAALNESLAVLDKGWLSPVVVWRHKGLFLNRSWFIQASQAMDAFMADIFGEAKTFVATLATELKGVIPHYSHIFTPTKLNQKLAVQVLLDPKTLATVSSKVKGLHKMLNLLLSLGESAQISVVDDLQIEQCRGTLGSGVDCISAMAAAKVLYGMGTAPTKERTAEAKKLLSKERPELSKAVVDALKKLL